MVLVVAEFLFLSYLLICYRRTSVPLAIGWFLLWAAPSFAEGMRDGAAKLYGVTTSNSALDIAAIGFVIVLVVGCMMGRWVTTLVASGLMLLIWAT
jgi:hypothetical protein